jgi:serine/threonine-protein kinase
LDRLQSYDDAPMGAGLAQLADANRGVIAGLTRADTERSGAATAAEVRARLVATAVSALERISTTLVGQMEGVAWTAQVTRSATGFLVSLGDGELMIRESDPVSDRTKGPHDSPIDIVAASLISVTGRPNAGYKGRSHTLWFCDAVEAGSYAWYETAFMDSAFGQPMIREVIPFALPVGADALGAISVVVSTTQVAWPFTRIDPGDTSEFVERWAGWLAQAAQGTLNRPGRLPERDCRGSWRQQ